ncbi:glutamate-gated chloride channel-like [Penaeus monodon]|uniref:glutamate-gated chloride channel-like n=1 Tax=Penaeus monodon TaxID=6687 RepID=UPI0018A6F691|nr:glutamate-gated chloride channel-like [Penaeus monodon]
MREGEDGLQQVHIIYNFPSTVNIFSGYENSIEISQLYTVRYNCEFNLAMFPFDSQICSMHFTLVSAAASYMVLVPGKAIYSGPENLIEYTIGRVHMAASQENEFATLRVDVRFYRRFVYYLLTLYIPSALLMIIAYASLFFNPLDFNSRIVVALTALLVLSSLFTQTSNSLPKTSYFKMVDVWFFFSIVIIFLVVLLQTLIDFSAGKNWFICFKKNTVVEVLPRASSETKLPTEERPLGRPLSPGYNATMLKFGQIILPIIFLVFNLIYWGSSLVWKSGTMSMLKDPLPLEWS